MTHLFTSESVSEGHPDKIADQISDSILDEFIRQDEKSKVACETFVTTGLVHVGGEVRSNAYVDIQEVVRKTIKSIGYDKPEYKFDANSCGIISTIHEQSEDISQGVIKDDDDIGAGDQGIMFGYASNETDNFMPINIYLANKILQELSSIRKEGKEMTYLGPDSKCQVTIEFDEFSNPIRVHTIVISTQHQEFLVPTNSSTQDQVDEKMIKIISEDIKNILIPRVISQLSENLRELFDNKIIYFINPTGRFVIGGPHGDSGLTGRKIIVDTYGGIVPHGGGAFSGKDATKVDRSAAYATRHMAKNLVAAGVCDKALIQVSYAIGVSKPLSLNLNTFGTTRIKGKSGQPLSNEDIISPIGKLFDLRPKSIIDRLKLNLPIYLPTSVYGHFGKESYTKTVDLIREDKEVEQEIELFTWEKLNYVDDIKEIFNL